MNTKIRFLFSSLFFFLLFLPLKYLSSFSIFTGTCDAPVCLDGNDDFCGLFLFSSLLLLLSLLSPLYHYSLSSPLFSSHPSLFLSGQLSKVSLTVVAGTELLIMVHSSGTTTGEFELTISKFAVPGLYQFFGTPLNTHVSSYKHTTQITTSLFSQTSFLSSSRCENTTDLITLDRPVYGSSREGIRSPSIPSCGARNYGGLARFYRFISPKKAFYEMDTCLTDSGFDTQLRFQISLSLSVFF